MAMETRLSLRQSQRVVMTPLLQQAIQLLQLSTLELQEVVQKELLENPLLEEVQEFVTGTRPVLEPDRQLATVLFTDVVKSTDTVASIGDKRWRDVLDRHDDIVHREVERHGGRLITSTGDGVLATFNGPAQGIRSALAIRDAKAAVTFWCADAELESAARAEGLRTMRPG